MNQEELNMRQRWWVELIKDYNCMIEYHPSKANVAADALSRKIQGDNAHLTHLGLMKEMIAYTRNECGDEVLERR